MHSSMFPEIPASLWRDRADSDRRVFLPANCFYPHVSTKGFVVCLDAF